MTALPLSIDGPEDHEDVPDAMGSADGESDEQRPAAPGIPHEDIDATGPTALESRREAPAERAGAEALGFLADVALPIEIRLGAAQLAIGELLELAPGSVVALERRAEDPVEIVAAGRVIARGEMVVVDDGLGVRITELCGPESEAPD